MGNSFWEQFAHTGKVDSYLLYREEEACRQVADDYMIRSKEQSERKSSDSDKNSNWNGA